jgi:2-(1,2-epoxy-1,2-dihydrophenyl)acetyl-CoA isomerase
MGSVEHRIEGGVLTIEINRPERLNAMDAETRESMLVCANRAIAPDVRAVVLRGSGRAFTAGVDVREVFDERLSYQTLRRHLNPFVLLLQAAQCPVVSVLDGLVVGAGIGIGLSADVRVGGPDTRFLPSFVQQGVVPDSGTTYFASRAMGHERATRWLLLGEEVRGRGALDLGLLTDFVEEGSADEVALAFANRFAALPRTATAATLALLRGSGRATLSEQLEAESTATGRVIQDPETAELRRRHSAQHGAGSPS